MIRCFIILCAMIGVFMLFQEKEDPSEYWDITNPNIYICDHVSNHEEWEAFLKTVKTHYHSLNGNGIDCVVHRKNNVQEMKHYPIFASRRYGRN